MPLSDGAQLNRLSGHSVVRVANSAEESGRETHLEKCGLLFL